MRTTSTGFIKMATTKVAVVTGSNKGIGFAIVRGLCQAFDGDVYLTSRDEGRGQAAVEELMKEGLNPKFHQLDIEDHSSVERLYGFLKDTYNGLDILVNNAGIAYKRDSTAPVTEQAEVTMKINFWSTLDVCDTLFPLLRPHARVVNVSSMCSQFALAKLSAEKKAAVLAVKTMEDVKQLMTDFVEATKVGEHEAQGWADSAYGMTKLGVTAMTIIQQANLDSLGNHDVVVNSCCPGYVSTDMSSFKGPLTVDQGAETPLFVAFLPPNINEPRGKFLREKKVADWN